jgi:hypothetical protein
MGSARYYNYLAVPVRRLTDDFTAESATVFFVPRADAAPTAV